MRKAIWATVALLSVGLLCNAQEHNHGVQTMNVGTASLLDGQRHALLHASEMDANGIKTSFPRAFIDEANVFRAEFLAEIETFNAQQKLRETHQDNLTTKQAMDNFLAWRDAKVGNHWVAALDKMSPAEVAWLDRNLKQAMARMQSTNPIKTEVSSLVAQAPNDGNYHCNGAVNCPQGITYSLSMANQPTDSTTGGNFFHQRTVRGGATYYWIIAQDSYNPIIDGGTTMNCPPACQGTTHSPNVSVNRNGTNYSASNTACSNCYLYATGSWTFPATSWLSIPGNTPPVQITDGGQVSCLIAGLFLQTNNSGWLWEVAFTRSIVHGWTFNNPLVNPFSTTTGNWIYPDQGTGNFSRNVFDNVNMGYYTVDNACYNTNIPDLDMSSWLQANPVVYITGGTLRGSDCGGSGQMGCPTIPEEGGYTLNSAILYWIPPFKLWLLFDGAYADVSSEGYVIAPDNVWNRGQYYWLPLIGDRSADRAQCNTTEGFTPIKLINEKKTL